MKPLRLLDPLKQSFYRAVVLGRGDNLRTTPENILSGKLFIGSEAQRIGLIDALGTYSEALEKAATLAHVWNFETRNLRAAGAGNGIDRGLHRFLPGIRGRVAEPLPARGRGFLPLHPGERQEAAMKRYRIPIAAALFLLPVLIRGVWFYQGVFWRAETPPLRITVRSPFRSRRFPRPFRPPHPRPRARSFSWIRRTSTCSPLRNWRP